LVREKRRGYNCPTTKLGRWSPEIKQRRVRGDSGAVGKVRKKWGLTQEVRVTFEKGALCRRVGESGDGPGKFRKAIWL